MAPISALARRNRRRWAPKSLFSPLSVRRRGFDQILPSADPVLQGGEKRGARIGKRIEKTAETLSKRLGPPYKPATLSFLAFALAAPMSKPAKKTVQDEHREARKATRKATVERRKSMRPKAFAFQIDASKLSEKRAAWLQGLRDEARWLTTIWSSGAPSPSWTTLGSSFIRTICSNGTTGRATSRSWNGSMANA